MSRLVGEAGLFLVSLNLQYCIFGTRIMVFMLLLWIGIVFNPTEKGLAYARTDIGGVYKLNSATDAW